MNDQIPLRADVEAKLIDLIEGRCSRDEVSSWAGYWILRDFEDDLINDRAVLSALEALSGADLGGYEWPYLHYEEDFRVWLHELRQAE